MATRADKLARAAEIIEDRPGAGRRQIAKELRQEFGSGLRDEVILSLQRLRYPEKAQVTERYLFAKESEGRFKPRRESRYNKLVRANFTATEALKLSKLPLTKLTFSKDMATGRKETIAKLQREGRIVGWSATRLKGELKDYINYQYDDSGWTDPDGNRNPYSMLRQFRRAAITRGDWNPADSPWRKKKSIRAKMHMRWKGDTTGQHRRWRELHKDTIKQSKATYRQKQKAKAKK